MSPYWVSTRTLPVTFCLYIQKIVWNLFCRQIINTFKTIIKLSRTYLIEVGLMGGGVLILILNSAELLLESTVPNELSIFVSFRVFV